MQLMKHIVVWTSKSSGKQFLGFGSQNLIKVLVEIGGGIWHHHESCVKAKQSHEEPMTTRSTLGCVIALK